ncbi:uncharacterized protein LOC132760310 isoform X1 [Ruditapes philippinarum]|uniref:uncharacterized protein LOC132760310 isoform X1 n=1 Tax=Ruditapes philippinarum TaxID=129788 RepID=UPI00295C1339|nr:uncharacterized protein LOC132760310 isoform X1 [Ruditapes philippinarum]
MDLVKKRSANFSEQECVLLMEILGEVSELNPNLTRYQYLKHKFTNGITSKSKRDQWNQIHNRFVSCSGTSRNQEELEKKTNNLVQKHRNLYSDFKRNISQTGGGPRTPALSFLTEAVMAVVGKESVSVAGVCLGEHTDTTIMTSVDNSSETAVQLQEVQSEEVVVETRSQLPVRAKSQSHFTSKSSNHCEICCKSKQELNKLKKRKLELEIELLKKKLHLQEE